MKGGSISLIVGQALLLALALAAPLLPPALLPWAAEGLFILAAFQLRLTDRRWERRAGWRGWTSHIRMAPTRLVPSVGIALIALIGIAAGLDQALFAAMMLIAVIACELLIYPLVAPLLGRLPRMGLAGVMALLLCACALAEPGQAIRFTMAFALGMTGCVFWLRGPDGEPDAALLTLSASVVAVTLATMLPVARLMTMPMAMLGLTLSYAHLSSLRRQPIHWRLASGMRFMRP